MIPFRIYPICRHTPLILPQASLCGGFAFGFVIAGIPLSILFLGREAVFFFWPQSRVTCSRSWERQKGIAMAQNSYKWAYNVISSRNIHSIYNSHRATKVVDDL